MSFITEDFKNAVFSILEKTDDNSGKTQVGNTGRTYRTTGEFLKKHLQQKSKIISIGAGLDHTKEALHDGLGREHGHEIHDMEPNPERRKTKPEYTEASEIPHDHYHAGVSHNVVNVVPPHIRKHVYKSLFDSVKEGGHIVIGARKWTGDVEKTKHKTPVDGEEKSIVTSLGTYQHGYDGDDLKNEVEEHAKTLGHKVTVKKVSGIAATAVHVVLHKKNVEE